MPQNFLILTLLYPYSQVTKPWGPHHTPDVSMFDLFVAKNVETNRLKFSSTNALFNSKAEKNTYSTSYRKDSTRPEVDEDLVTKM